MAIHHILVIFGLLITLGQNSGTGYCVLGLFVSEVSNPAMHIRIMLRNLGKRYTRAYEVAEYTYFISFFIGRVIIGHPVVYISLMCPALSKLTKFVSLGITAQSYLFLYRIYFVLNSRLKETAERRKKNIKFSWLEPIPLEILKDCQFYLRSRKTKEKLP